MYFYKRERENNKNKIAMTIRIGVNLVLLVTFCWKNYINFI